jgi:hypothetical protein
MTAGQSRTKLSRPRLHRLAAAARIVGVAKLVADLAATGDGRAQVITLALVLEALESRTPKNTWLVRQVRPNRPLGKRTSEGVYSQSLADAAKP